MQEAWIPCKIHIKAHKQKLRRACVVMPDVSGLLEPRTYVVLLIRHKDGTVYQVPGAVRRRLRNRYVEVDIPLDAALSLAAYAGISVEKSATIYGYSAQIKNIKTPPDRTAAH
jgi:hypothetical protein